MSGPKLICKLIEPVKTLSPSSTPQSPDCQGKAWTNCQLLLAIAKFLAGKGNLVHAGTPAGCNDTGLIEIFVNSQGCSGHYVSGFPACTWEVICGSANNKSYIDNPPNDFASGLCFDADGKIMTDCGSNALVRQEGIFTLVLPHLSIAFTRRSSMLSSHLMAPSSLDCFELAPASPAI